MKKIKLVFTYIFALLCVLVTLYKPNDYKYVHNVSENEDKIVIYTLKNDYLVPISLLHKTEDTVKKNIELSFNLMKEGINQFGFTSIIPNSVQLLNVEVINNLIKLNFNEAIYMMNSNNELKFIEAVVNSVLQFNDDYKVQFYVNGEKIDKMPLSNRKMNTFDKSLGINNFELKTYDLYQSDSKKIVEYIDELDYSHYVINSIRVEKDIEILQFINMVLNYSSNVLFCEKVEMKDDIMIIHLNESFLYDENTISKDSIINLLYTLKINEYSNKYIIKVNNEVKRIQDYKTDIITINELYLNVFEQ